MEMNHRRRQLIGAIGTGAALLASANGEAATPTESAVVSSRDTGQATAKRPVQGAEWSEPLTRYVVEGRTARIPEDTRELARRHVLDTLAAIVACRNLEPAQRARNFALSQSAASKVAAILGTHERCAPLDAIMASAMTAHAAEINDFCPSAFVQPGASVIPATLCIGDIRDVSGDDFLRAMVAGYEIACRLPKALGIRNLSKAVLANHSVGPLFGTAVAIAQMTRLPAARFNDLYSYCVQQASGSWQWLRDVDHIEKAFVFGGMPARRGSEAALFVEAGFTGVGDPFTGDPCWLNSSQFTADDSDFNADYLTTGLGHKFELALVGYKRYPVGGPTQPVIELMLDLITKVDARKVRKVRIEMPGRTGAFAAAQMPALNMPYLCSIMLADGKLDFVAAQSRQRFLTDAKINAFMPNVEVIHDDKQEAQPRIESARVILTLDDGSKREQFLHHVKGFPEHPFDRADVEAKALELMGPTLGSARAKALCETVWKIEALKSVRQLVTAIAT